MKRIHLLQAMSAPADYAALLAEARSRRQPIGWLDWDPQAPPPSAPTELDRAAALGAQRAVSVGRGGSVAVKPFAGPPVLRDVLREHFRGCSAVLVRSRDSNESTPQIEAKGELYEVRVGDRSWSLTPAQLCDRLRRPRPFE